MSIQDRFENAVADEDAERRAQHAQNADVNSHRNFFADKRPKKLSKSIATGMTDKDGEGYKVSGSTEENAILMRSDVKSVRQEIRRGAILKDTVMDALTKRVQEPTGFKVMKLSFKDWQKMHEEYVQAEKAGRQNELTFVPFSVYGQKLTHKPDGTPREKPIRPLLKGEVGQFMSGPHAPKIIVIEENSPEDDGKIRVQVPSFAERLDALAQKPIDDGDPIDKVLEIAQK